MKDICRPPKKRSPFLILITKGTVSALSFLVLAAATGYAQDPSANKASGKIYTAIAVNPTEASGENDIIRKWWGERLGAPGSGVYWSPTRNKKVYVINEDRNGVGHISINVESLNTPLVEATMGGPIKTANIPEYNFKRGAKVCYAVKCVSLYGFFIGAPAAVYGGLTYWVMGRVAEFMNSSPAMCALQIVATGLVSVGVGAGSAVIMGLPVLLAHSIGEKDIENRAHEEWPRLTEEQFEREIAVHLGLPEQVAGNQREVKFVVYEGNPELLETILLENGFVKELVTP